MKPPDLLKKSHFHEVEEEDELEFELKLWSEMTPEEQDAIIKGEQLH